VIDAASTNPIQPRIPIVIVGSSCSAGFDHLRDLGIRADSAAHQRHERTRVLTDVIEIRVEPGAHSLDRCEVVRHAHHPLDELVRDLGQPADVEIALRREVVIEQPLRDLGFAGEIVDRHVVVRAIREGLARERQELRAAGIVVEPDSSAWTRRGAKDATDGSTRWHVMEHSIAAIDLGSIRR